MIKLDRELSALKYYGTLLILLLLTDFFIVLNIPFLRQIFGFIYFTVVPGLLILQILRLNNIEFLKKFVLSMGLSIAFLMFVGLFINSLYPLIERPLSFYPVLVSLNASTIILVLLAYLRNKYNFNIQNLFNFRLDIREKYISPIFFSFLFPFMAVFGTYLMNSQGNNIVLLLMLFLIPIYVAALIYLRDNIPEKTYPISIWMIGLSLLLMHGLTCYYIIGSDIHLEHYVFRLTLYKSHWSISNFHNPYNACLSITILPTIFYNITAINTMYIYKVLMQIIFSLVPVILYGLYRKYISGMYSFLACFYFISQSTFIFELVEHTRQEIALLFFTLILLIIFDDKIAKVNKVILILILITCVIVSHYTTAYVMLFILFFTYILMKIIFKSSKHNITLSLIFLCFVIIFFWYGQLTEVTYTNTIKFFEDTIKNLWHFYELEARSLGVQRTLGFGLETIPDYIRLIVRDITYFLSFLGILYLLINYKKEKFEIEYISMILASSIIVIISIVLPYISKGYGVTRLFLQVLSVISPTLILGSRVIFRILKSRNVKYFLIKKISIYLILIILILQNICATTVIYNMFGIPLSADLNTKGNIRESLYIFDEEVISAKWLAEFGPSNLIVRCDKPSYQRILLGYEMAKRYNLPLIDSEYFYHNISEYGYVYLRVTNVKLGKVHPLRIYPTSHDVKSLYRYMNLFINKNKIYSDGGSEIWY